MPKAESILTAEERGFAVAIQRENAANPFLPERIAAERAALGAEFSEEGADWNARPPTGGRYPNITKIQERCGVWLESARAKWPRKGAVDAQDAVLYEEVALDWLFHKYAPMFDAVIVASLQGRGGGGRVEFFPAFKADFVRYLDLPGLAEEPSREVAHIFACVFQVRRAFHNIFESLVGSSKPMVRLRAEIWQSICTHDLGRYRRTLYSRMADLATLISGPSGTGKELVARAVALSQYIPYEPQRGGFREDFAKGFFPLNLAALSPTLIESELFGHRRGSFTGALADRDGWMEVCPASGAVFLDEIGEVETGIQVKLLRVLQSRTFEPLGGTESRRFKGKIIAATNRGLPEEIRAGRFREDFYYRLCSDQITTPSLRDQLDDAPGDLGVMAEEIATRVVSRGEAVVFARDSVRWIEKKLGKDYAWPGNYRELEQCLRNLLLRGEYRPAGSLAQARADDWNAVMEAGELTAEELLRRYTRIVFAQTGSIEAAARRLNLDRRTVKARLEAPEPL